MASAGILRQTTPTAPAPAPAGYTRDPNTGAFVPIAGGAVDTLAQRTRQQAIDDAARQRATYLTDQDRAAQAAAVTRANAAADAAANRQRYEDTQRDALRGRLISMLDRPEYQSVSSGAGYGGGPLPPMADFSMPSGGGGGGGGGPAATPAPLPSITPPDTSAAQANAFARAKDQVALQTASSLASLRSALAGRGMLGGGGEVRGTQNVLTAGQAQLGDVSREQAIQEGQRLTDFAKAGYEGAITQRGQDITARGQDIQAQAQARADTLHAAETGYEGQIQQRGQNVSLQAEREAGARQAAATRNASVTALLGRLY